MSGTLDIIGIELLRPLLDRKKVIARVENALIQHAAGNVQSPPPGHLIFEEARGDCHVKFGHMRGAETFVVKIATGFYDNPKIGLPAANGMMILIDARNGQPRAIFRDEGWLTAWRTAAATAIAARALAPETIERVGVLGAGQQGSLALEWLPETLGAQQFAIWARDPAKARAVAAEARARGQRVEAASTIAELLRACNLIVTTTPSASPLFEADAVRPGTHVVAIGADMPGKQELPAALFERAACVLVDDLAQCRDHGEFGAALRAGFVGDQDAGLLGRFLANETRPINRSGDVTIVDLTGLAAQDMAIAELFWEQSRHEPLAEERAAGRR